MFRQLISVNKGRYTCKPSKDTSYTTYIRNKQTHMMAKLTSSETSNIPNCTSFRTGRFGKLGKELVSYINPEPISTHTQYNTHHIIQHMHNTRYPGDDGETFIFTIVNSYLYLQHYTTIQFGAPNTH